MASGKKQYVISTAAYGHPFTVRSRQFDDMRMNVRNGNRNAGGNSPQKGPLLDHPSRQKETIDFFKSLARSDRFMEDPEIGPNAMSPIDPIRVMTNRLWAAKGRGDKVSVAFLSGSMTLEADETAYNAQPFDIVFSDNVTKTGDGILPDAIENKMTRWRDTVNGKAIASGLFPVYQENIKLVPVESAFNQYYLALTGLTTEEIAKADEIAENPQHGEASKKSQIGSLYQREGSVYVWNLMRYHMGKEASVVGGSNAAYEDYSTYVNKPFTKLESKIMSFDGTSAYAYAASEYNFYSLLYEKFSKFCPELLLPSMLMQSAAETQLGDPETVKIANDNITLGGAIRSATAGNVIGRKKKRSDDAAQAMLISSAYWNEFGAVLARVAKNANNAAGPTSTSPTDLDALANSNISRQTLSSILRASPAAAYAAGKMKNLVFSGDYGPIVSDPDKHRENYPMYAEVSFTADHFAQFSDHIDSAGLMPDLIDSIIASEEGNQRLIQDISSKKKPETAIGKPVWEAQPQMTMVQRADEGIVLGQKQKIAPLKRNVLDVESWLYKIMNDQQDTQKMTGRLHAHASVISGEGMTNSLEKQIKTIIALGKIKDMVADYVRRYSQILSGEPAYSEIVVYQVKKSVIRTTGANQRGGAFVQNFWFSNSSKLTNINFMDTQVHYGKEYVYEIFAHTLVIGTKYDIANNSLEMSPMVKSHTDLGNMIRKNAQELKTMTFADATYSQAVWYTPTLKIVKTRIHAENVIMFDSAPIVPEVEFVPYKGISHKILCVFKGSVGRQQLPTIFINSDRNAYGPDFDKSEQQAAALQRKYQKNELLPGENLLYESDDRPEFFEVYRTTKAPYSYSDFDGLMYARVSTRIPSEKETYPASNILPKFADSATMVDIIMPNQKYYYMMRQIDVHGNFSNPTPVFEVEMVDQEGVIYPIIKEYIFKDPVPRTNKKYFNKYIKIAPTVQQVLINKSTEIQSAFEAANGSVQLGAADVNIWGKKYKVRITSNTTGKSADLNIQFNQKHTKTATETEGTDVIDKETGVRTKTKDITAGRQNNRR